MKVKTGRSVTIIFPVRIVWSGFELGVGAAIRARNALAEILHRITTNVTATFIDRIQVAAILMLLDITRPSLFGAELTFYLC